MAREKQELARKIYNQKSIEKMDKDLKLLGSNCKYETIKFMNIRLFTTLVIFILGLFIFEQGYIMSPIVSILYYYFYKRYLVTNKIKKRRANLESEAMHFFEVLTLSLETGRNLNEALKITTKSVDSELSFEFKNILKEAKYGKSLTEALNQLQEKIPSESINNIIITLTQSDLFGSSIIDTMYNQIDYLREKRKLEVKAEISKIPTKISVISVLFFVPLILMIILAPVLIGYLTG